jgi:hypothetical protein
MKKKTRKGDKKEEKRRINVWSGGSVRGKVKKGKL